MLSHLESFENAFSALPAGIDWAELNADLKQELHVSVANGALSQGKSAEQLSLFLRVNANGKEGSVYTESLSENPYVLLSRAAENAAVCGSGAAPKCNRGESMPTQTATPPADTEAMIAAGCAIEQAIKRIPNASPTECFLRHTVCSRRVINSMGLDRSAVNEYYHITLGAALQRENGTRSQAVIKTSIASLSMLDADALAAQVIGKASFSDGGGNLPHIKLASGSYDCLLMPDIACNILTQGWRVFSAANMASGGSPFSPAAGTKVGSAAVTLIDAPSYPGWGHCFPLDSEGSINPVKAIVKEGLLQAPLHTLETGGTGNAGRAITLSGSVPIQIQPIPSILYFQVGEASPQALLDRLQNGLLMTYSLDVFHSINLATGTISIPCGGIVYRNGIPVGLADQMTLTGSLKDLFCSIEAAGNDVQLREFNYANYCFGGPSLLARGLKLSCMD